MRKQLVPIFMTWVHCCISINLTKDAGIDRQEVVSIEYIDDESVNRRERRDTDIFKSKLKFSLRLKDQKFQLNLRKQNVKATVPLYMYENGFIVKHEARPKKEVVFYTDVNHLASISVQCKETGFEDRCQYLLKGRIFLNGEHHVIRPRSVKNLSNAENHHLIPQQDQVIDFGNDGRVIPEEVILQNKKTSRTVVSGNPIATTHYKVELLPCTDFGIYEYWYNQSAGNNETETERNTTTIDSIMEYYAYVINDMNVHYESIQGVPWDIEIVYAGIFIATSPTESTWTESIKFLSSGEYIVDGDVGLNNFKQWLETNAAQLPDYDHAMLFTRYDLFRNTSSGPSLSLLGLAWVKAICFKVRYNAYYENSIVEDKGKAIVGLVAAHELGHNLGASHDISSKNNCSADDRYVMAPSAFARRDEKATNHYIFSNCSIDYFKEYIDELNQNNFNCMASLSANHDPSALDKYNNTLQGQIYNHDEQCMQNRNHKDSYLCRNQHYQDPTTVCKYMYCKVPDTNFCSIHIPWEGTLCGDGKWCIAGKCCEDVRAQSANSSCVLGDAPFCAGEIIPNPHFCYDQYYNPIYCCGICQKYYTGITGCEYGDRISDCVKTDCPNYDTNTREISCCKTCAQDESTTEDVKTTGMTTKESTTMETTPQVMTTVDTTTPEVTTTVITTVETTIPEVTTTEATTSDMTTTEMTTLESTSTEASTSVMTTMETSTPERTTTIVTTTEATTPEDTTTEATTTIMTTTEMTTLDSTTTEASMSVKTTMETTTPEGTTTEATTTVMTTTEMTTLDSTTTEATTPVITTTVMTTTEMTTLEDTTTEASTPVITTTEATTPVIKTTVMTTTEMTTLEDTTTEASTPVITTTEATTPVIITTVMTTTEMTKLESTSTEATTAVITTTEATTPIITIIEETTPIITPTDGTTAESTTTESTITTDDPIITIIIVVSVVGGAGLVAVAMFIYCYATKCITRVGPMPA
ncbi:zinc metalloproteinase-disintegrin-like NaMP [Mytilus californianus]|uniref:zinc metalloproteinase-disintegrin-like NaMP n=1 Tax=Mytilus californianus TaxID=6549 RepID=UPI0022481A21|nr:zinc metalloproteinase-disintegrin-like NaMP [Mytilus californianus]